MHQYNWIRSIIGQNSYIGNGCAEPFEVSFVMEWYLSPIDNHHDAMGVLLMGGEL